MDQTTIRLRNWDGFVNSRDLGGLSLESGGRTKFGSFIRSEHPNRLSDVGRQQLYDSGVTTVISLVTAGLSDEEDLRQNNPEMELPLAQQGIAHAECPVEDGSDPEFMWLWADTYLWGTPLYFIDTLTRHRGMFLDVLQKLADAPGPVLFHCGRGIIVLAASVFYCFRMLGWRLPKSSRIIC